jgi:hypothetical protein
VSGWRNFFLHNWRWSKDTWFKIDCLIAHTACLVCLVSAVSSSCKNTLRRESASSRHITKLEQSTFLRYLCVGGKLSYGFSFQVWGQCYKTFYTVIYERLWYTRVFVPGRNFKPSLMFVGKIRNLPWSGAPERCFTRVGSGLTHKH